MMDIIKYASTVIVKFVKIKLCIEIDRYIVIIVIVISSIIITIIIKIKSNDSVP